jgi:hypothetical protein
MLFLLETLAENLVAVIIVFLVLFALIVYLFARDNFFSVLYGFFRIIISFFYSPVIYMKKAVLALAEYGIKGEVEFMQTRQYLLNKLMISLQAFLVVISIVVLASSLVSGWNQMLPPKDLSERILSLETELGKEKPELPQVEQNVKRMEDAWLNQHDSLVKAYNIERTGKRETISAENADLANRISQIDSTIHESFIELKNYHSQNEHYSSASQFENIKIEIEDFVNRLGVSEETTGLMLKYNDNWYALMLSTLEISDLSESQLRFVIQPTYNNLRNRLDYLTQTIPTKQEELTRLQAEVKYEIKNFFMEILYGILQFILLVWVMGLLIESLWLAIHIGANVQKIHDNLANK